MMVTEIRLKWLNNNKKYGDVAAVVKAINGNKKKAILSYNEAISIINGNLYGTHGNAFIEALEARINDRLKLIANDKEKYSQINNNNLQ